MNDLIKRLREWGDLPTHVRFLQSTESIFDQGNRHKSGAKPADYLLSWLSMLRPFAFATKDESWGEMEKLLCIVMRNYINVRKDADQAADRLTAMKAAGDGLEEALGDLLGATEEVGYVHYAPFRAKARAAAPILMEYGARLMREAAARKAYVECAVARHVRLGDACQIAIGDMDPATIVREAVK